MKLGVSAETVLEDIEFELMQSVVCYGELGQATQSVRAHQTEVWAKVASQLAAGDEGEAIKQLYRLNEMLLTLLEQVVAETRAFHLELRKLERLAVSRENSVAPGAPHLHRAAEDGIAQLDGVEDSLSAELASIVKISEMLENADQVPIALDIEARPCRIPVVGAFLSQLRTGLHSVAVFYVRRFAAKQSHVNEEHRDVLKQLVVIAAAQQEQIESLRMQLRASEGAPAVREAK